LNWWECEPHRQIFGTGEIGRTDGTGERILDCELGTSCKLALAGGREF